MCLALRHTATLTAVPSPVILAVMAALAYVASPRPPALAGREKVTPGRCRHARSHGFDGGPWMPFYGRRDDGR